jgi:hypothetical protein
MTLAINPIVVPVIGPVDAGTQTDFEVPIAPVGSAVTSPLPAGATVNASVILREGRPARLTFVAPDAVTAAVDVDIELQFGADAANRRVIGATVRVNPAP